MADGREIIPSTRTLMSVYQPGESNNAGLRAPKKGGGGGEEEEEERGGERGRAVGGREGREEERERGLVLH